MNDSGYASITVEGETINLRFGIPAIRMFLERATSDTLINTDNIMDEVGISTLLYCGYVNNCMVDDLPVTKTKGFFLKIVEDLYIYDDLKKQIENAVKAYSKSRYTQKILDSTNKEIEEIKKKTR